MANNDDGMLWLIIIVFALLYWIVMIIIEYFAFFLILGLVIWAIYYYSTNAPKWEQERKVRATFASNNTRNHTNFKDLYATAEHNIEVLASSCFALADNYVKVEKGSETELFDLNFKEDISRFSNKLKSVSRYLATPHKLYNDKTMNVNHNPYFSATQTVNSLIEDSIKIPNILLSLEKRCTILNEKDIDSYRCDRFTNILLSISSNFTIDNHRRLHLVYNAEMVEEDKQSKMPSSVSTTEA